MAIQSFRDASTRTLYQRTSVNRWVNIETVALRKLMMLDAAVVLSDLRIPPQNRLELLKGQRAGQYSIRINDQWRICFAWSAAGPQNVEIVDYH